MVVMVVMVVTMVMVKMMVIMNGMDVVGTAIGGDGDEYADGEW